MKPTEVADPEYLHKVVDCQFACPAHTLVPAYIRLMAPERYTDTYLINWESNVFPGILGRTCDRPCEPACRRGWVEEEPVAICRLKRFAADFKDDVAGLLPKAGKPNGKKIALIGAGPASLTVAPDLAHLSYELRVYDEQPKGGGFMRSQISSFRLPETVLDEEIRYVLDMGVMYHPVSDIAFCWLRNAPQQFQFREGHRLCRVDVRMANKRLVPYRSSAGNVCSSPHHVLKGVGA